MVSPFWISVWGSMIYNMHSKRWCCWFCIYITAWSPQFIHCQCSFLWHVSNQLMCNRQHTGNPLDHLLPKVNKPDPLYWYQITCGQRGFARSFSRLHSTHVSHVPIASQPPLLFTVTGPTEEFTFQVEAVECPLWLALQLTTIKYW